MAQAVSVIFVGPRRQRAARGSNDGRSLSNVGDRGRAGMCCKAEIMMTEAVSVTLFGESWPASPAIVISPCSPFKPLRKLPCPTYNPRWTSRKTCLGRPDVVFPLPLTSTADTGNSRMSSELWPRHQLSSLCRPVRASTDMSRVLSPQSTPMARTRPALGVHTQQWQSGS